MTDSPELAGTVARLDATVSHLNASVKTLTERVEGMRGANWSAIGVLAAIAIPTVSALAWGMMERMAASEKAIDRTEARLERRIEVEQERNNRLEREMGRAEMIDSLFAAGKLNLSPGNGGSK